MNIITQEDYESSLERNRLRIFPIFHFYSPYEWYEDYLRETNQVVTDDGYEEYLEQEWVSVRTSFAGYGINFIGANKYTMEPSNEGYDVEVMRGISFDKFKKIIDHSIEINRDEARYEGFSGNLTITFEYSVGEKGYYDHIDDIDNFIEKYKE
jgi:hypothetical protein